MEIVAFNGSPRKDWNTATLLKHALEGAASQGAKINLIHLYDLIYQGCKSCFACKKIGGSSYGKCAVKDDLTPILDKIREADALLIGSPIYIGAATGETRSFFERLVYPYLVYDGNFSTLFPKKIPIGFIFTMGVNETRMKSMGFDKANAIWEIVAGNILGPVETLLVTDTYQFDDYSKYMSTAFNPKEKAKRRDEQFPKDCEKAYEMGLKLASTKLE